MQTADCVRGLSIKHGLRSNFPLLPPLLGDQFSRIPKVSESNDYTLEPLVSDHISVGKRTRLLLELKDENFLLS